MSERDEQDRDQWLDAMSRIARMISDSLEASWEVGERHAWRPADASEAASEREDPRLGEGVAITGQLGWVLMSVPAHEGMETFIDLILRYPPRAFSPYPVARMSIETLARAAWLYEAGIGARERAARGLTEILVAMRARGGLPGSDDLELASGLERVDEAARGWGLKPKCAKDGMVSKVGDVDYRHTSKLIEDLYEVEGLGVWAYSDTSSMAHGNVVELFKRLSEGSDDEGDYQFVDVRESQLRVLAAYVLQAWWFTDVRRVDYLGWRDAEWTAAAERFRSGIAAMMEALTS